VSNTNNNTTSNKPAGEARAAAATTGGALPRFSTRPVDPFALSCAFDRQRGEFIVHAGARAGACAVIAVAVLTAGTFGFIRNCFHHGPGSASAAEVVAEQPDPADAVVDATVDEPAAAPTAAPKSYTQYARRAGLNYLILKSFPSKKAALSAREVLIRKGVATTVERSLPGWSGKGWYSLVGMTGFELDREQDLFDRHVADLKKLKLDPKPYMWRDSEVAKGR
jgi:hypothetical protein